jgi:hypothetical protein
MWLKLNTGALLARLLWCAGALGLAPACLDNKLDTSDAVGGKTVFIAQARDFATFADWMVFKRDTKTDHGGILGTTTIYLNSKPDAETHTFPIGTILFKRMDVTGFDQPTIHAMAKRGSGFNAEGALGWEYFELLLDAKNRPAILWRGDKPPSDEQYQALLGASSIERPKGTDGACNSCHADGQDGVLDDDILELLNGP